MSWLFALSALTLAAPAALAQRLTPVPSGAETGFSGLTQSYTYAPPDEGEFTVSMEPGCAPHEYAVETPERCEGHAYVHFKYSKSQNKVWMDADYEGLPFRMSVDRGFDPSTHWNQHLQHVENGHWQIWINSLKLQYILFYYDALTGELLCNEIDCPTQPPGSIVISSQVAHLLGSPEFEGKPNGKAHVHFEFAYDNMIDNDGTGGNLTGYVPERLCEPDHYVVYYSNTPLPPSQGLNWDEVLQGIHAGAGLMLGTSLEPSPKPAFLHSRDNIMILDVGTYPQTIPHGYTIDLRGPSIRMKPADQCGESHNNVEFPSYYNFCPAP